MKSWFKQYDARVYASNNYRDINFARECGVDNNVFIPNGAGENEFGKKLDIERNLGLTKSLNRGLKLAKGEVISVDNAKLTPEVSILIPTRNRAHVLERTLPSYISQGAVGEIIVVDDASTDNTRKIVEKFSKHSLVPIYYFKNEQIIGAAGARNIAIEHINMPYAVWGEDDLIFGKNYVSGLLRHLKHLDADIVGGRVIYLEHDEPPQDSLTRMNQKLENKPLCDLKLIGFNFNVLCEQPINVPFLHALILTKTNLLKRLKYDERYGGNGYREDTDFQINALKHGGKIFFCPDVCCFHLSRSNVKTGGQHDRSWLSYEYWTIRNNNYFLDKYYLVIKEKFNLSGSKSEMKWTFAKNRLKNYVFPHIKSELIQIISPIIKPIKRIVRNIV